MGLKEACLISRLLDLSHGGAWVQPLAARLLCSRDESTSESILRLPDLPHGEALEQPPNYLTSYLLVGSQQAGLVFRLPDLPHSEARFQPPDCLTSYLLVGLKKASLVLRLLNLSHGGTRVQPLAAQLLTFP